MSNDDRITRPPLPRSEPQRSWTTPAGGKAAAPPEPSAAPPQPGDVIANAVDLGYRVLDEYVRQGQSAARRLGVRADRAEAVTDDLQTLANRMARYTSDFLGVWSQFVDVALTSGAGGAVPRSNGAAPAAAAAVRTTIAVRVDAARPVTVAVDVEAAFLSRTLTVQEVRSGDPTKPPLPGVRLEPATPTAPARLQVAIAAAQPAGAYTGVVVDEATGRFAGTIGITIDAEATP